MRLWVLLAYARFSLLGRRRYRDASNQDAAAGEVPEDQAGDTESPPEFPEPPDPAESSEHPASPTRSGRFGRARAFLSSPLAAIRGAGKVDEATFEELEEALLLADVGLATTTQLLNTVREGLRSGVVAADPEGVLTALQGAMRELFSGEDRELHTHSAPSVWLFVGVNGVGKTTTIGKLAAELALEGRHVVLAAGDTFRAAANDQLALWAEASKVEVVSGEEGADPSSVVFDAVVHAAAIGADLVLADSAGRLHTKVNLMAELGKVRRVADRPPGHVSEVILVLDATTGQNGLTQARQFKDAVEVTGIALTKLDGTAKGGIVLAIRAELGLPVKLVGLGEGPEDLVAFDPDAFITELFA